jgi:hypothetical protein
VHALLVRPEGAPSGWEATDLADAAKKIPGVEVHVDVDGREARAFGAVVSGHALLFDPAGALLFSGGLTAARGHEGDSVGQASILAALRGGPSGAASAATFGCEVLP